MKTLLLRTTKILVLPRREWRVIGDEQTTYKNVIFGYVGILALLPPAAALAGRIIFDRNIPNAALASSIPSLVLTNALWYCMYVLNVIMVGAIISAIVTPPDSHWNPLQGLKIAAYSFTPLFIAGFIAVFPKMHWIIDVAILYSIYLLYLGILLLLGMKRRHAIWYAIASFTFAAIVVVVMNLVEYFFESLVVRKLVS